MRVSVVLASCRSPKLVAEAVGRLLPQCQAVGADLIVARATAQESPDPEGLLAGCQVVPCLPTATIPEIRGAGLAVATGDWVFLTEDNCIPRPDWVARMMAGMGTEVDIVGGTMANAHTEHAIDAGAFFSEYGFFGQSAAPVQAGPPLITGANVAYCNAIVAEVAQWASAGIWETGIHSRLAESGRRFRVAPDAVVEQNLHYQLGAFCRDRYEHGYDFAVVRGRSLSFSKRIVLAVATPILPVLLTSRVWRSTGRLAPGTFLKALPFTLTFFSAWAVGEALGYLSGRGRG